MTPLEARIADLVPMLDYGLEAFLRSFEIEESRAVPTAGVPLGRSPRILVNPDFVQRECKADEDLAVVILHELHHVMFGDTRLHARITPAQNIAMDAVINATIARRKRGREWTALFRRMYRPDRFPECLLRPPEGYPDRTRIPRTISSDAGHALTELYGGYGTLSTLLALLERESGWEPPKLLGSHDGEVPAPDDPARMAAEGVLGTWEHVVGTHPLLQAMRHDEEVQLRRRRGWVQVLARAILAAARPGAGTAPGGGGGIVVADQPTLAADRRSFACRAQGFAPLLSRTPLYDPRLSCSIAPVDIYVDVSGSCRTWWPELLAAIDACRRSVAPRVYQFSTQVVEASLDEIARGRVRTTGGTTGACVTERIASRPGCAAVVLTDGYVGPIPREHAAACRRARLQVVLTPRGRRNEFDAIAAGIHFMEGT